MRKAKQVIQVDTDSLKEKLIEVSKKLSGNDVITIASKNQCSTGTVYKYLRGEISQYMIAVAIYNTAENITSLKQQITD